MTDPSGKKVPLRPNDGPVSGVITRRPWLLDLFCGAGGATKGYQRAGFFVVGVDLNPQPNYCGDRFVQADALDYLSRRATVLTFDAVAASPPCQGYSGMSNCRPGLADEYPRLIGPVRNALASLGLPYVIENVADARPEMVDPIFLCGQMFGFELYRHRLFEASGFDLPQPDHPEHVIPASKAGHWKPGTVMSVAGHVAPIAKAREVMDIDWCTRDELGEAIPPYFTEYVGAYLLATIRDRSVATVGASEATPSGRTPTAPSGRTIGDG